MHNHHQHSQPVSSERMRPSGRRRAAAAVEMALITPVLAMMVIGMLEIGRGMIVQMALNDAARRACETGTMPMTNNAAITSDVNDVLQANNIPVGSVTIVILINDQAIDAINAKQNDKVSVKVSIPVSQVSWTKTFQYLFSTTITSEKVVLLRRA